MKVELEGTLYLRDEECTECGESEVHLGDALLNNLIRDEVGELGWWVDDVDHWLKQAGRVRVTIETLEPPDVGAIAQERANKVEKQRAWREEHPEEAAENDKFVRTLISLTDLKVSMVDAFHRESYPLLSPLRNRAKEE